MVQEGQINLAWTTLILVIFNFWMLDLYHLNDAFLQASCNQYPTSLKEQIKKYSTVLHWAHVHETC